MKVFAILCLVFSIQCTQSLPVDEQNVLDVLEECEVSFEDDSLKCLHDLVFPSSRMDIDFDTIVDTLEGCGFSFTENSLGCFLGYADELKDVVMIHVLEGLDECEVSYEDDSFDCLHDIVFPSTRMDIDFETIVDTLKGCGFSFTENSLGCFMGYANMLHDLVKKHVDV